MPLLPEPFRLDFFGTYSGNWKYEDGFLEVSRGQGVRFKARVIPLKNRNDPDQSFMLEYTSGLKANMARIASWKFGPEGVSDKSGQGTGHGFRMMTEGGGFPLQ